MSNESNLRQEIKEWLLDNEAEFFDGIYAFGEQRRFAQVSKTTLTPPTGYFFCSINVRDIIEESNPIVPSITKTEYRVIITIVDYIGSEEQGLEHEQLYERMDESFRTVTDRVMNKLRESSFTAFKVLDEEGSEKRIQKINSDASWSEGEIYHLLVVATIEFTMVSCP